MCFVELRKCYEKCTRNWYFDSVKWKSIKYQFCTLQDNYNLLIKKLNLFHTGQKTTMMKLVFSFRKFIFFWTNLCCHISGLDHTRCILLRLVIRATLLNILRFLQILFRISDYLLKFYARKETKSSYWKNPKKSPTWPKMSNVMAQPACQHLNWDLSTIWTFSFQFSNFKLLNAILKSIEVSNFEINLEKQEINMQQICATPSSHDCK